MGRRKTSLERHERRHRYVHLGLAFGVVMIFSLVKWLAHDSIAMDWLRQQAFLAVHHWLRLGNDQIKPPPVVLVDISRVPRHAESAYPSNTPLAGLVRGKSFIDRRLLSNLIRRVAALQPVALAIDVDLSPEFDGTEPPPYHLELLEDCRRLTIEGTPVFCGVGRSAGLEPAAWLAGSEYKEQAVLSLRFPGSNALMPSEITRKRDGEKLLSISQRLADRYFAGRRSRPDIPAWLGWAVLPQREVRMPGVTECTIRGFYVNYHFLNILTNETLGWISAERVLSTEPGSPEERSLAEKFKGRTVIFGDARMSETFDVAGTPGQPEPIPGVYLHAAATCTLISSPLSELKSFYGLVLSFLISAGFILLAQKIQRQSKGRISSAAGELLINVFAIVGALGLAIVLAAWVHVLWLEVIAACVVFCGEFYAIILLSDIRWTRPV